MKHFLRMVAAVALVGLASCSPSLSTYTSPSFAAAASKHKTIAILPFDVQVGLRPNQLKRLTPEQHYDLELKHGRAMQSTLQVYFLNTVNRETDKVAVQDVNVTNAILKEQDIQPEELQTYAPTELAQMLGVEAVLVGTLITEKPLSNVAAAALLAYTLLVDPELAGGQPTNMGSAALKIFDGPTGELLWSYDNYLTRGLGSDTHTIVKALTRKASRKIPYTELKPGAPVLATTTN